MEGDNQAAAVNTADTADLHVDHAAVLADPGAWLCCVPCHWLRTNNSVHKASLTIATLLVTSLLVASPVLFLISSIPGTHQRAKECLNQDEGCGRDETRVDATCTGDACRRTASRLLASMSRQADPCRDFYQFACGGWGKEVDTHAPLAPPPLSFNTLQDYVNQQIQELLASAFSSKQFQKLGHFYNSCLKTKERRPNIGPIFTLLDELGGYLGPGAPEPPDLSPLLSSLLRVNGALLFDVYLDRDLRDGSRLAVFVDLPRRFGHTTRLLHRPRDEMTLDSTLRAQYHLAASLSSSRYKRSYSKESRAYSYMKDSAEERRLMGLEKLLHQFFPSNLTSEERIKEAHSILLFASMLNKLYPREKDIINKVHQKDSYRMYNLTQLQENFEFVQWQPLMEEVFSSNFSGSDVVYVVAPAYLASLQKTMPHFHKRVAHNALLLVYARDILLELVNATAQPSWPGFCTRVCVNLFPRAVGALYVQQFSPAYLDELRKQVTMMFDRLRGSLATRVRDVAWLDDPTRVAALRKLASLKGQFLTWPGLWNNSAMAAGLQEVNIDHEDFFGNVIRRYRQLRTMPHDFRNQTTVEKKWAYPFVVNAFYELTSNGIVIPLAVLTQPYFRGDVPRYVRYATIGMVLAHEIMHAFDLTGIGYGPDGAHLDWFTPDARLRLEARMDCIAKQYGSAFSKKVHFLGSSVNVQFDWNLTRNENMADLSGLQVAYESWRGLDREGTPDPRLPSVDLSPTQLFFLNAAQAYCSNLTPEDYILLVEMDFHTPFPERVNGIMMNTPAFAEAFNCPTSSPMNPSKKCSTW